MMKHTWILPLLLCAVVCLFGKSHAAKFQGKEQITFNPYKRCCAPDQYEANLLYTGSNHKGSTSSVKDKVTISYDYTNTRWALNKVAHNKSLPSTKIVFDYKADKKYIIRDNRCVVSPIGGEMEKHCVPKNATYHGLNHYGMNGKEQMGYDTWSHETILFPIVMVSKWARDSCHPIQEGSYGLVSNNYQWIVGNEPPCVPWQNKETVEYAKSGYCGKCFHGKMVKYRGPQPTAQLSSSLYDQMTEGIHHPERFVVPLMCEAHDTWPTDIKLGMFEHAWMFRLQHDQEVYDEMGDKQKIRAGF